MFKSILIPVDLAHGTTTGRIAAIARRLSDDDTKVTLLHVVETLPMYVTSQVPPELIRDRLAETEKQLEAMAKETGLDPAVEVTSGHAANAITEYAQTHDVDCIVIASHRPGMQDYFLGSTAARVVRHARCPVFVDR